MEEKVTTAKERVELEKAELVLKMNKLGDFLGTEKFKSLDGTSQELLLAQWHAMGAYCGILNLRLENWKD